MRALLVILLLLFFTADLSAQSLSTKSKKAVEYYNEADNYRVRRQYDQAIDLLNAAIKKDDNFIEAYVRLAGIYHIQEQLDLAEQNYQKAIELRPKSPKSLKTYLYISQVEVVLEKYAQAKSNIEQYLKLGGQGNQDAKLLLSKINYALEHIGKPLSFHPTSLNAKVNQFAMQYFPVVTADEETLFYTKRNGNSPYDDEDIMVSYKDEAGEWGEPKSISPNINTELNEGTCAISADGRTLVFTSCQGRGGYGSCDLYISHKNGDQWSKPMNMGAKVNSSAWESQPSLSADGRTLYFVSNRKGGVGGRDIWVSKLDEKQWLPPQNVGNSINTPYEDVSPFIHPNGVTLYFASNGLAGFGGFDIYYNELDTAKNWRLSKNLGYPINRGTDQMSLTITADGSKGFYSDSGGRGQRASEIKQFDVPKQIRVKYKSYYVRGAVTNKVSKAFLKAQIQLYDLSTNQLLGEVTSDSVSGEYLMVLTEGSKYGLYIEKENFVFQSISFDLQKRSINESLIIDIELSPISKGVVTVLNNIFFEHDSYALSDESLIELNKVARFIENNSVKLEIGGYTDHTGTAAYNLSLSQKRAKSVYDYLINVKNIPQSSLTFHGYGQAATTSNSELIVARRIEFKVL